MDRGYEAGSRPFRVLAGGQDATHRATYGQGSTATQGDVARGHDAGVAVGPFLSAWPDWAETQLLAAVKIVRRAESRGERQHLAAALYRDWFCPSVGRAGEVLRAGRPLAGLYRNAHTGSGLRRDDTVRRHDVIGRDGWWRTWGDAWTPPRSRPGSVRLLMTPRPDQLAAVVRTITGALLDSDQPWLLACATDPRRLRRTGSVVLDLAAADDLPDSTFDELVPSLRPLAPPLCLPVAPGIALAEFPDNQMTFGEHRCHLIAVALRRPEADAAPLAAIAEVFSRHGIAPAEPYRTRV